MRLSARDADNGGERQIVGRRTDHQIPFAGLYNGAVVGADDLEIGGREVETDDGRISFFQIDAAEGFELKQRLYGGGIAVVHVELDHFIAVALAGVGDGACD